MRSGVRYLFIDTDAQCEIFLTRDELYIPNDESEPETAYIRDILGGRGYVIDITTGDKLISVDGKKIAKIHIQGS